jgi:hypothetical protein
MSGSLRKGEMVVRKLAIGLPVAANTVERAIGAVALDVLILRWRDEGFSLVLSARKEVRLVEGLHGYANAAALFSAARPFREPVAAPPDPVRPPPDPVAPVKSTLLPDGLAALHDRAPQSVSDQRRELRERARALGGRPPRAVLSPEAAADKPDTNGKDAGED